jgi:hypothetical protein
MPRESKCITQRHPIHKQELKFKQNKIEKVKTCENPEAIEQKDFFFFHILILVFALAGKKEKKKKKTFLMPRESKCITQHHPTHKQELKFKQNKIEKVKTCENPEAIEQKDFSFFTFSF